MASSRLEKIGTIYTRVQGLLESKAMKPQDVPIWYELYEAFPPKEEPTYARSAPNIPLKRIFYEEDKIRAEFHKNNKNIGIATMLNPETKTLTQHFIETYKKLDESNTVPENELYSNAIEIMKQDKRNRQQLAENESSSIANKFKEAQRTKNEPKKGNIDVGALFKE